MPEYEEDRNKVEIKIDPLKTLSFKISPHINRFRITDF
jgi:hypothetical protein